MADKRKASRAEWVAQMVVLAERDRDSYRQIRAEAWRLAHLSACSVFPSKMN